MRRLTLACVVAVLVAVMPPALGDDDTHVIAEDHGLKVGAVTVTPGQESDRLERESTFSDVSANDGPPSCSVAAVRSCIPELRCVEDEESPLGGRTVSFSEGIHGVWGWCDPSSAEAVAPVLPEVTQPVVLRALRRVGLPASVVVVQPPGGRTLVNFDTLFRTEAGTLERSVRLLGRRVDLEIWPASFTWRHGDGSSQVTDFPGRAYAEGVSMGEYVSHRYTDAGVVVRPSVDTTYAARFRVDGGRWRDVRGTVTVSGSGEVLRVVEGRPTLVSAY